MIPPAQVIMTADRETLFLPARLVALQVAR